MVLRAASWTLAVEAPGRADRAELVASQTGKPHWSDALLDSYATLTQITRPELMPAMTEAELADLDTGLLPEDQVEGTSASDK